MKKTGLMLLMLLLCAGANASEKITVYQDPDCGCCHGWAEHMREAGFSVTEVKTQNMSAIKRQFAVPDGKLSCHTAVIEKTGQVIEGHVPANAVSKLLAHPEVKGVAAPGMPHNSPGMGALDGNLVTVDFNGNAFSKD